MSNTQLEKSSGTSAGRPERVRHITPAVSIHEDADGYTIEAEMPGVGKEGVEISVENGELTFAGTRHRSSKGQLVYGEVSRADYRRTFDLDPAVDTEKIAARMEQGVLSIRLPKAHDKKPRRITVTG